MTSTIVGLPRSRTTWLAELLTYGNTIGLHEYVSWGGNALALGFHEYSQEDDPPRNLVFVETEPSIISVNVPTLVIVKRDAGEVIESLQANFKAPKAGWAAVEDRIYEEAEALEWLEKNHKSPHVVSYKQLDNISEVQKICQIVKAEVGLPRIMRFRGMRIKTMNTMLPRGM